MRFFLATLFLFPLSGSAATQIQVRLSIKIDGVVQSDMSVITLDDEEASVESGELLPDGSYGDVTRFHAIAVAGKNATVALKTRVQYQSGTTRISIAPNFVATYGVATEIPIPNRNAIVTITATEL